MQFSTDTRPSAAALRKLSSNSTHPLASQILAGSLLSTEADVSLLLEFISEDDRPTFIVETAVSGSDDLPSPSSKVVFQNDAFTAFSEKSGNRISFQNWLQSLAVPQETSTTQTARPYGGRAWSMKHFKNAWTVVYSSQLQDNSVYAAVDLGRDVNLTIGPYNFSRKRSKSMSQDDRMSIKSGSSTGWGDADEHGSRKFIDWTRYPVSNANPWTQFLQKYPWENTGLGPMQSWPDELRRLAVYIMACPEPRMIYWGDDKVQLYNEAAAVVIAKRHPEQALGTPYADVWGEEILTRQMELIRSAIYDGRAAQVSDWLAVLERHGYMEETYWDMQIIPCVGADGCTTAAVNEYTEVSSRVFEGQRRKLIGELNNSDVTKAVTLPELWQAILEQLGNHLHDSSFALLYSETSSPRTPAAEAPRAHQAVYQLQGSVGADQSLFTPNVVLDEATTRETLSYAFQKAIETQSVVTLETDDVPSELAIDIAERGHVRTVSVLPLLNPNGQSLAFVVLGMNPMRSFAEDTRLFVRQLSDLLSKSAALIALPEEQKRNQQKFEEINIALAQQLRITALKAEKNEETFTRMARNAPFGMYMFSSDGQPKYVNDAYLKLLTMSTDDFENQAATGLAWRDTIVEEDREFIDNAWRGLTVAKTPTKFEYRVKVPPKTPGEPWTSRWLETISFPELDEDDNVVTVQGWLTDISHRKLTESLMSQRLEDALETKRASERFIDMVSHEMRNPLSAILQLADGVLTSLEVPKGQTSVAISSENIQTVIDSAETIMLCAQHQKCIVDDILTLSKLDSNLLVITPDKVQPVDLCQKALKMYEAEFSRAKIEASLEVRQDYKDLSVDYVTLDPSRVLQVIINLITNAIKFTQDSDIRKVTLSLAAAKSAPSGAFISPRQKQSVNPISTSSEWGTGEEIYISFAVQDTGKGLTEEEMKLLFHRFQQASPKTYKQYGGSGLGLFISRELTELQGGQIGVYSEAGIGSTFVFYVKARRHTKERKRSALPMEIEYAAERPTSPGVHAPNGTNKRIAIANPGATKASTKSASAETNISDLHILVVEDNAINQKVMAQQLRRLGCTVHVADHGLEALTFLHTTTFYQGTNKVPLSIVLMDLEMPVMDGLTCVRRIRQMERAGEILKHVPVIAITANARSEQISTALEAGMDEVVTKPFRIPDLMPKMQKLIEKIDDAG